MYYCNMHEFKADQYAVETKTEIHRNVTYTIEVFALFFVSVCLHCCCVIHINALKSAIWRDVHDGLLAETSMLRNY